MGIPQTPTRTNKRTPISCGDAPISSLARPGLFAARFVKERLQPTIAVVGYRSLPDDFVDTKSLTG